MKENVNQSPLKWVYGKPNTVCKICGKLYRQHSRVQEAREFQRLCNGTLVKI